jgi:hypothetical protein
MTFKVTEFVDYLDLNPDVQMFDTRWEADEYIADRIHIRVEFSVQHTPYMVSEKHYNDLVEYESTFFNVKEIEEYAVDIDGATD